jgi:hypothetical protein
MKLHNDLIMELPDFVPKSFCDHLIQKFENDDNKKNGNVCYEGEYMYRPELKESMEIHVSSNPDYIEEDKTLYEYIYKSVELYNKYISDEYSYKQSIHTFRPILNSVSHKGLSDKGYVIQRQKRGSIYKWHYDSEENSYLFGMLYLNTLQSHEGGCTEFINGRKVRPECGKIMLCPASWTYAHTGNEVKTDYKYTVTFMIFLGHQTDN